MNRAKKILNKTWDYVNGRKRNIGIAVVLIGLGLKAFNVIPPDQAELIGKVGGVVGGFGWAHSVLKDEKTVNKIKENINKANSLIKNK